MKPMLVFLYNFSWLKRRRSFFSSSYMFSPFISFILILFLFFSFFVLNHNDISHISLFPLNFFFSLFWTMCMYSVYLYIYFILVWTSCSVNCRKRKYKDKKGFEIQLRPCSFVIIISSSFHTAAAAFALPQTFQMHCMLFIF